jgi:hypothetical protein
MATGRTVLKHARFYVDGYDLSGLARTFGPLLWDYPTADLTTLTDEVKGGLSGQPNISVGTLRTVLTNTASGIHAAVEEAGTARTVMAPIGIRAAPAAGDPVFVGVFQQGAYKLVEEEGAAILNIPFSGWNINNLISYDKPWADLVHAHGAETAVNSGTADVDGAASSSKGGYGVLQVFAGNGTCTFSIEHSGTNTDGAFDSAGDLLAFDTTDATVPRAEIKSLGKTATVNRYLRWQISLGTATTVTFAIAFVRGT